MGTMHRAGEGASPPMPCWMLCHAAAKSAEGRSPCSWSTDSELTDCSPTAAGSGQLLATSPLRRPSPSSRCGWNSLVPPSTRHLLVLALPGMRQVEEDAAGVPRRRPPVLRRLVLRHEPQPRDGGLRLRRPAGGRRGDHLICYLPSTSMLVELTASGAHGMRVRLQPLAACVTLHTCPPAPACEAGKGFR